MPFGLKNGVQTYMDDLPNASTNQDKHLQHVQLVFEYLSEHATPKSASSESPVSPYLGHHIKSTWHLPLQEECKLSETFHRLRELMGMVNFYYRFLSHCPELMRPLYPSKTDIIAWNDTAVAALKEALAN